MLPENPTHDQILAHINTFKVKALNLAMTTVANEGALLEPRELKTLVDLTLNIEDSLKDMDQEGQQARAIQRLLDKYSVEDMNEPFNTPAPLPMQVTLDA